jgi:hypothetical protein
MNTTAAAVNQSTANPNKQQKQTAKEVIAANVQALIEQLEHGHSEALTAYLTAMGRFHTYSFGNILEIARQKPDATRVAGLYAWNQLGRKVKKGERGIRILAPVIGIRRKKDEEAEKDIRTQNQAVLVGFRAAYVFERLSRDLRPGFYAPDAMRHAPPGAPRWQPRPSLNFTALCNTSGLSRQKMIGIISTLLHQAAAPNSITLSIHVRDIVLGFYETQSVLKDARREKPRRNLKFPFLVDEPVF